MDTFSISSQGIGLSDMDWILWQRSPYLAYWLSPHRTQVGAVRFSLHGVDESLIFSVWLSVCLSVCPSVCRSERQPSIHLFIHPSTRPSIYRSIYPPIYLLWFLKDKQESIVTPVICIDSAEGMLTPAMRIWLWYYIYVEMLYQFCLLLTWKRSVADHCT